MKKRGISPLIATVLIVGFVIIASILVYNWGFDFLKGEIDKESQKTEVANTVVGLDSYGYGFDCDNSNLCVFVANDGNVIIEKIDILVDFTGGQQILSKDKVILPYQQGWVHLDGLNCANGDITSVKIIPSINLDGEVTPVEYASAITSSVRECGEEMADPGEFVWEEGRPSCEFNCEYSDYSDSILYSDQSTEYGLKDFTFFKDQYGYFHIISIKSIKCAAEPGCECVTSYCKPYDPLAENEFLHYTSTDLVNWNLNPEIIQVSSNPEDFDSLSVWAPHVVYEGGTYYMFYTGVKMEDCPGAGQCYAQRIMLATSTDAYNWEKQGFILDCDVSWNLWGDDAETSQGKRACRDPMVYKKEDGNWIMYLSTLVDDSSDKNVVAYATSNNLDRGWVLQEPIQATRGYGQFSAESPFLFNYEGKYYFAFTNNNAESIIADDVVTESTPVNYVSSLGSPTEYILIENEGFGEDYLVRAWINLSITSRPIYFEILKDVAGYNLEESGPGCCASCDPQPNLGGWKEICEYNQDCQIPLGCNDYSEFLDYQSNPLSQTFQDTICCDTGGDPSDPSDACCENTYLNPNLANLSTGQIECWEICGSYLQYPLAEGIYPDITYSGGAYCDSGSHCNCVNWECVVDWDQGNGCTNDPIFL